MTKKFSTQVHEYSGQVISLCFDSAQHDTLNDRERSLIGVEVNIN